MSPPIKEEISLPDHIEGDEEEEEEEQERSSEYCKDGYHLVRIGDVFANRYRAIRKLGWGAFSTVWLCFDLRKQDYVALKISKSEKSLREGAQDEMDMLYDIKDLASKARLILKDICAQRIVTLLRHFEIKGPNGRHICMVFEVLGDSLFKFMTNHYPNGIPLQILKRIVRQILEGLAFLHTKCRLIHTDIKPENILLTIEKDKIEKMHSEVEEWVKIYGETQLPDSLVSTAIKPKHKSEVSHRGSDESRRNAINTVFGDRLKDQGSTKQLGTDSKISVKIADLGNAVSSEEINISTIQTRPYRCPEVLLGLKYNTSADIWSLGVAIFELATGNYLFDYEDSDGKLNTKEILLLRFIERLGPLPKNCRKGRFYKKYFTKSGRLIASKEIKQISIEEILITKYHWKPSEAQSFSQFLLPMLRWDGQRRASAVRCLSHQWLK